MTPTGMIATLSTSRRRSITWYRGREMAEHVRFKIETGSPLCFCAPQAPGNCRAPALASTA